MNLIVCADLHLEEKEKSYSFSVLKEIIDLCKENDCQALLLAGDIFDSLKDLKNLRTEFCNIIDTLPASCSVYFLPGNHELPPQNRENLENYNFGRAKLLAKEPWSFLELDKDIELITVPFQYNHLDYRNWDIPKKNKPLRILLAHGTVEGTYTGPGENDDIFLEEDLFLFHQINIAFIGHIHRQQDIKKEKYRIMYPGSARVSRKGEEGKRNVLLCNINNGIPVITPLYLKSAGEYRVIPVFAKPNGNLSPIIEKEFSSLDWLHLELTGFVEEQPPVIAALEKHKIELEKKYRKVTVDNDKLEVLAGVSSHPLALSFIKKWEEAANAYKDEEEGVYEQARIKGLLVLKEILEKRK